MSFKTIIRNILAIIIGVFIGSIVNMSIVLVSSSIIPPPEGADVTTLEGLKASMHLFGPKNFIMPFLAHALGTFAGAIAASLIAATHKMKFALAIGAVFIIGGIINIVMLPSPIWFTIIDIAGAYFPMAYFAFKLTIKKK